MFYTMRAKSKPKTEIIAQNHKPDAFTQNKLRSITCNNNNRGGSSEF